MSTPRQMSATVRRAIVRRRLPPATEPAAVAVLTARLMAPDLTTTERAAILRAVNRLAGRGVDVENPVQGAILSASLSAALGEPYRSGNRALTARLLSMARIVLACQSRTLTAIDQALQETRRRGPAPGPPGQTSRAAERQTARTGLRHPPRR